MPADTGAPRFRRVLINPLLRAMGNNISTRVAAPRTVAGADRLRRPPEAGRRACGWQSTLQHTTTDRRQKSKAAPSRPRRPQRVHTPTPDDGHGRWPKGATPSTPTARAGGGGWTTRSPAVDPSCLEGRGGAHRRQRCRWERLRGGGAAWSPALAGRLERERRWLLGGRSGWETATPFCVSRPVEF